MKRIGMFAKFWQAGQVKTRLFEGDQVSSKQASQIYRLFVEHLVRSLVDVADDRDLVFTPGDAKESFRNLAGENWNPIPQTGGDLGQRIAGYFQDCFCQAFSSHDALFACQERRAGANPEEPLKVLVIGGDCPQLNGELLAEAFSLLDKSPVVIGPSTDGGYYLIGLKQPVPELFQGIDWSTSLVFSQTVARLTQQRLEYAVLPQLTDVDHWNDLLELLETLGNSADPGQLQLRLGIVRILQQADR
jgi:glycosyltransferase A (GT-A) superfamily protein (DUF2064 family)